MIPINVGDTIQVSFGPHMATTNPQLGTGTTTAAVTAVDNVRRIVMLNHLTGPLVGKPSGQVSLDHVRATSDTFVTRPVGALWQ